MFHFQVERQEVPDNQAQASEKLFEVWEGAEALVIERSILGLEFA